MISEFRFPFSENRNEIREMLSSIIRFRDSFIFFPQSDFRILTLIEDVLRNSDFRNNLAHRAPPEIGIRMSYDVIAFTMPFPISETGYFLSLFNR